VLLLLLLPVLLRVLLLQHLLLRLLLLPLLGRMLVLVLVCVRAQAGQRDCAQRSYWGWRRGYRASQPRARFLATARQRKRGTTDDAIDGLRRKHTLLRQPLYATLDVAIFAPSGPCGTCTNAQGG
jgi:hypothetical protein